MTEQLQPSIAERTRYLTIDRKAEGDTDDKGDRTITVFANEHVDRGGPDIVLKGLSLTNYRRNPIVLFNHMTSDPIARSLKITKDQPSDGKMQATFRFGSFARATEMEQAWDDGIIRAASIRWRSIKTERIDDEETPDFWTGAGLRDIKSELLEWSLVSIPADPDAVRSAMVGLLMPEIVRDTTAANLEARLGEIVTERLDEITQRILMVGSNTPDPLEDPPEPPEPEPVPAIFDEQAFGTIVDMVVERMKADDQLDQIINPEPEPKPILTDAIRRLRLIRESTSATLQQIEQYGRE